MYILIRTIPLLRYTVGQWTYTTSHPCSITGHIFLTDWVIMHYTPNIPQLNELKLHLVTNISNLQNLAVQINVLYI